MKRATPEQYTSVRNAALEKRLKEYGPTIRIDLGTQVHGALQVRNLEPIDLIDSDHLIGLLPLSMGGTGSDLSGTGPGVMFQPTTGGNMSVGSLPFAYIDFSGNLTSTGIPLLYNNTGVGTATWAALSLSGSAVTGTLPPGKGGTGTANTGNLAWASGGGTAALLGTANQAFTDTNSFAKILRANVTSGTTGYGLRFWDGSNDFGNFQALDSGGATSLFFSSNRFFTGTGWDHFNTRVGGNLQVTSGADLAYFSFAASSDVPVEVFRMSAAGLLTAALNDTGTNNAPNVLRLRHITSGTPAAGFGLAIEFDLDSSTTANQLAATDITTWATATHASRKARRVFNIYDTAAREAIRIEASGTAPLIGFLGAAAVARQSVAAAAPAGGTGTAAGGYDTAAHRDALITLVNDMRTAGINLGFWS